MQTSELFLGFVRRMIFGFLLLVLATGLCHAQNSGNVGIYTREVSVFTNQSATKSSAILPDFGFASQTLFYCTTAFEGTIDFEWSPAYNATSNPSATFYSLTQASYPTNTDTACHQLQLGQYWPNLRSTVTPFTGSVSAWYSASSAPISFFAPGIGSNGAASPAVCDQSVISGGIATGTTGFSGVSPRTAGDTVILCGFTISFNGATSAGALTLAWFTSSSCATGGLVTWQEYTTASTPQLFSVPITQRSFGTPDQTLCVVNNSGASVEVSFAFASVHGS